MAAEYVEIELINGGDIALARKNIIRMDEIKRVYVTARVDGSFYRLSIHQNIQEQLQLPVLEQRKMQFGYRGNCTVRYSWSG
jgi:hypothetical protein